MTISRLMIRHLSFTGPLVTPAEIEFSEGCNLIWGASNTGKSFTLKAIDFMLGGSKKLPDISERQGYDTIQLSFTINGTNDFILTRSINGGAFSLYKGLDRTPSESQSNHILDPAHKPNDLSNLSNFLLSQLGFKGKFLAKDSFGNKESLSFRDLAHILIANEIAIQAERSPIEGGQHSDRSLERSVFRLMLTGLDDSTITPVEKPQKTKEIKATKLELLDEIIAEIDDQLSSKYPDIKELASQEARLNETLTDFQTEFDATQGTIRALLERKQALAMDIPTVGGRLDEIELHLDRFTQLNSVYVSDIERLEALEEAGFLVSLLGERDCPLCGAYPEAQLYPQCQTDVEQVRIATIREIEKIRRLRADLEQTVSDLRSEQKRLQTLLPNLQKMLEEVEGQIAELIPKVKEHRRSLDELIAIRDRARTGLALSKQKENYLSKREEIQKIKAISKKDKPQLGLSETLADEFCQVVSHVLTKWGFPGQRRVSFDSTTYDLKIDGKPRSDNGKGVRAVTHAAFKVALLLFCRSRELPHPGLVILDTPLLTYRDPIKNPRFGQLSPDEKALAQTSLKTNFFEFLYSIRELGQFIIFENVDLPDSIADFAKVETFLGHSGGRIGLFPNK